ncbi:putative indole-3-pyruvate monooxygenase YUCCA3 [Hypsizygus marmoreus]|uniref:Indole-3-pyruvate monooxygenase YUCCA3 n=1 Tax=Hypsizygus marmoreus TaxID=39966 RepID=A0A369JZ96_HYPMA|nr:putative indole-3-pyruvate monooxygenase YUCCA3 [Hypsizygus marmoreus]
MASNSSAIPNTPLPTLSRLGIASLPDTVDATAIAKEWLTAFSKHAEAGDAQALSTLFVPNAFFRDMLALTWDFRTFSGIQRITQFLTDRLPAVHPRAFVLRDPEDKDNKAFLGLQQPFEDLAWIALMFDFETDVGIASGIARLVPVPSASQGEIEWKAHTVFTNLEDLKGFTEAIGPLRSFEPNHGKWEEERKREAEFVGGKTPSVVIVGGGQSGLEVAARLKVLGVPALVVEKNGRVGDNWRNRYEALCLHDPVWYDHMPYLPFPPTWPVYTPALKLAKWLEHYAEALELNVWTSSTVVSAKQDPATSKWHVVIRRGDGTERTFDVNHVVFATGLGGGEAPIPQIPGMDVFKGQMIHSYRHKSARDHLGKKVVIVGACTAAHDIAVDYYENGVDVTMYQRSSTYVMSTKNGWKVLMEGVYSENAVPTAIADRLNASLPHHMSIELAQRTTKIIAELDKPILDGLRARGFMLNDGILGTGFGLLAWDHAGGYYLDTGASQLIADGKIKLKSGSNIERLTETGLKFEDGSELAADVIIFATGLGDSRAQLRKVCGDAVADAAKPVWGLDDEGEIKGVWRDLGVKGLWCMLGNLALCRFHSKHVALQIKAMEEGVFGERYSATA